MADDFYSGIYNPDVLSCIANLSNDEVFTPPEVANQMLDMLPQELFLDPNTKFLDPATKMNTKLFHLLMHLKKVSHHVVSKVYGFCPLVDFCHSWTDEQMYLKYGLNKEEIAFIEDNIKPLEEEENG